MQLYFSPLACSLATRVALYEAGLDAEHVRVNRADKQLPDGSDYRDVYPLALVPALRTDDDVLLTENIAVLQYVDERATERPAAERSELTRWLSFLATELHKGVFWFLFRPDSPDAVKAYVLEKSRPYWEHLDAHLDDRAYLVGDSFSAADAYLYTLLTWTRVTPIELSDFPGLQAFFERAKARPSVQRAYAEELPEYRAAQARQ